MATYSEIQERVLRRLIDVPSAVQAEVPDLINDAMKGLQDLIQFPFQETVTGTFTTSEGLHDLGPIPENFQKVIAQPYMVLDDDPGDIQILALADDPHQINKLYDTDSEGAPEVVLVGPLSSDGSGQFLIYPLPDGLSDYDDGEYRIFIPYAKYLDVLEDDADENWFTTHALQYLIFKATAEGFAINWDEERAAFWEQKAAAERQRVKLLFKYNRLGPIEELVPYKNANDPMIRRYR